MLGNKTKPPKWLKDPQGLLEFYIQDLNVAPIKKLIRENPGICNLRRDFCPLATLMFAGLGGYHGRDQSALVKQVGLILINEGGADINKVDSQGKAPLYYAVLTGNGERCAFCLDQGADPSMSGSSEFSPLITALMRNQPLIALMLIKRGANVRVEGGGAPANGALYYAVKLDVFFRHEEQNMWLWAVRYNIIEALLERGADPNQYFYDKNPQGYVSRTKPLQLAKDSVQPDIYFLLRAFKATAK